MIIFNVKNNAILAKKNMFLNKKKLLNITCNIINHMLYVKEIQKDFLLQLDDGRVINAKEWLGWEWTQGISLYAIQKVYEQLNMPVFTQIIDNWFKFHLINELPTKNINTMCPLLTLACRYEDTQNNAYLPILQTWAHWLINDLPRTQSKGFQHVVYHKENKQEIWDDTLMMSVLPLIKIGCVLKNNKFINEGLYQILLHNKYLADVQTGLWFHGCNISKSNNSGKVFWGRGNCWVTIALTEILELMYIYNINNNIQDFLIEILNIQIKQLVKLQHTSGLWHTVLNDNTSYLESSCTAGFAYAILKAVHNRYIDYKFLKYSEKAIKGLLYSCITKTGEVLRVSEGTEYGKNKEYYKNILLSDMPYGQALTVLAIISYIRYFDHI